MQDNIKNSTRDTKLIAAQIVQFGHTKYKAERRP